MSIEIYQKAKIIKKDDKFYYFLRHHSKNDCLCGGQYVEDIDFRDKWISRNSRTGSWAIKAIGGIEEFNNKTIADTNWNCPTSEAYGRIQFGNHLNIALYWAKCKPIDFYSFDEEQQRHIQDRINYYENKAKKYVIDLKDIPEHKKVKAMSEYCGDKIEASKDNTLLYAGKTYWNLDNL
jgi:hypothetical protein